MTKYEEYSLLIKEIDVLDAKKEILRAEIEAELPEEGFKSEIINCYWTKKNKYTYSDTVKELESNVKKVKKEEEENGVAKKEETKILTIKVA